MFRINLRQYFPLAVFFALGVVLSVSLTERSPTFQACEKAENEHHQISTNKPPSDSQNSGDCISAAIEAGHDILIAIGTAGIAVFTATLWWAAIRDERVRRTHERAYVIWGGLYGKPRGANDPPSHDAADYEQPWQMMIHNFGRTPGFVTRVSWGKCETRERFDLATIGRSLTQAIRSGSLKTPGEKTIEAVISPTVNYIPAAYRHVDMGEREIGPVYFGIIEYRDVFREKHYSTFAVTHTDHATDAVGNFMATDWS